MILLALHTTDARASIAVDTGTRVEAVEFVATGTHAPGIWVELRRALAAAGVALDDCDALAVTTGPGSFTGIRIGIATVQGLGAARDLPIWTCSSLAAHAAAQHGTVAGPLAVVLDARRGEVFAALYDGTDAVPRAVVEPFCATPARAAATLAAAGAVAVCGPGAECVDLPGVPLLAPAPQPIAVAVARLVAAGGCRRRAPRDLEPEYLRKSDAELQRHGPGNS